MGGILQKGSVSLVDLDKWIMRFESFEFPDLLLNTSFTLQGKYSNFRCSCMDAGHLTVAHGKEKVEFASIYSDEVQSADLIWKETSMSRIKVLLQSIPSLPNQLTREINLYLQPGKLFILNCTFSNESMSLLYEAFNHVDNLKIMKHYGLAASLIPAIFRKFSESRNRKITDPPFSWVLRKDHTDWYLTLKVQNAKSQVVDIYDYGETFFDPRAPFDFQLVSNALLSLNGILERNYQ